jgi:hypothetical protein
VVDLKLERNLSETGRYCVAAVCEDIGSGSGAFHAFDALPTISMKEE